MSGNTRVNYANNFIEKSESRVPLVEICFHSFCVDGVSSHTHFHVPWAKISLNKGNICGMR